MLSSLSNFSSSSVKRELGAEGELEAAGKLARAGGEGVK